MANQRKREYYLKNRDKRLAYQKAYYERYKLRRPRLRELAEYLEPEECERLKQARSAYNKKYYENNREGIKRKRAALKRKRMEEKRGSGHGIQD